MFMINRNQ